MRADLCMRGHACFVYVMYVKYCQVLWVCVPVCMCVRGWVIYSALCVCERARAAKCGRVFVFVLDCTATSRTAGVAAAKQHTGGGSDHQNLSNL